MPALTVTIFLQNVASPFYQSKRLQEISYPKSHSTNFCARSFCLVPTKWPSHSCLFSKKYYGQSEPFSHQLSGGPGVSSQTIFKA